MFNKLVLDLENIAVNIDGEDQTLLLLYVLLKLHAYFKETLMCRRESFSFYELQVSMHFNDLSERKEHKSSVVAL